MKNFKTWNKRTKDKFINIAKDHQSADMFIQWQWLQKEKIDWNFKWCFYWCMTQTEDNTLDEAVSVMKLPDWIIHVSEKIFEWLPKEEAIKFPLQLLEAVPTNTDIEQVWKDWNYAILMDKEHGQYKYCWDNTYCKEAVKKCADLFKLNNISGSAAWSARSAAWSARSAAESARSAAESAARSAGSAAESAAWSARSAAESARSAARSRHYIWMRDTLIWLLIDNKKKLQ